jgi:disulfide bond formation protein DsbB
LIIALGVISTGIIAALFRSKKLCRIYGIIMTVYAFIIGLTALLTGLDAIVLQNAVKDVSEYIFTKYNYSNIYEKCFLRA